MPRDVLAANEAPDRFDAVGDAGSVSYRAA